MLGLLPVSKHYAAFCQRFVQSGLLRSGEGGRRGRGRVERRRDRHKFKILGNMKLVLRGQKSVCAECCCILNPEAFNMDQRWTLGSFLFVLGLCSGLKQENCTSSNLEFESVFSVPGDVAMLNSALVSPDVFNFTSVPYNISWYDSKTGREMTNQTGRILVLGMTLWFLNLRLDDDGEYVSILRTPYWCYRQATKLVVERPIARECGRPRKARQSLTKGVTDILSCPLKDYMNKLDSYNISSSIQWYKDCEPIVDRVGRYTYIHPARLKIARVDLKHNCSYTCTLNFTLGGVMGSVSETIAAYVSDVYTLTPEVHEPANEIIKKPMGSNFSKRCRVFVPYVGSPFVEITWLVRNKFIYSTNSADRIYTTEGRMWRQDKPKKGLWLEQVLIISELKEKDFHTNYTCRAYSARGLPEGYFTLLPEEPDVMLPVGLVLGGVTVLFITSVVIYYLFKVDIALWFRRAFPVLYTNTAIVDSVEENIQASRRLLLLYTASTFTAKRHTSSTSSCNNNNNNSKSSDNGDNSDSKNSDQSLDGGEEVYPDARQQLEC